MIRIESGTVGAKEKGGQLMTIMSRKWKECCKDTETMTMTTTIFIPFPEVNCNASIIHTTIYIQTYTQIYERMDR